MDTLPIIIDSQWLKQNEACEKIMLSSAPSGLKAWP